MTRVSITRRCMIAGAGSLIAQPSLAQFEQAAPSLDVPYVPTPQDVVERMLEIAKPGRTDFLIDLGSGDGRIPITAARKYGMRALGVDLNPQRVAEARANAARSGVEALVEFQNQNLFETDISRADILTMYLLSGVNLRLRPKILRDMRPGSRVVSHAFDMGDWKPDRTERVGGSRIMLWTVPRRQG